MLSRLQQHAPDLPFYFQMHECQDKSHKLWDAYHGAGAAIILTHGDDIIDLVYVESDYQAIKQVFYWYMQNEDKESRVWFGMCSCTSFCDPLLIDRGWAQNSEDRLGVHKMVEHGTKHRFMGYTND